MPYRFTNNNYNMFANNDNYSSMLFIFYYYLINGFIMYNYSFYLFTYVIVKMK